MVASQNGFCSFKLSIHKKPNNMHFITKILNFYYFNLLSQKNFETRSFYYIFLELCKHRSVMQPLQNFVAAPQKLMYSMSPWVVMDVGCTLPQKSVSTGTLSAWYLLYMNTQHMLSPVRGLSDVSRWGGGCLSAIICLNKGHIYTICASKVAQSAIRTLHSAQMHIPSTFTFANKMCDTKKPQDCQRRRNIRLIEGNAKCRQVIICLRPLPFLGFVWGVQQFCRF